MKNTKYIMIGTPILSKEIFRKILRPFDNYNYKPNGGLWSCEYTPLEISPWYTYLEDARSITWYKDINHASLFTLKENARILEIDSYIKLQEIIKKYPSYHHILNSYNNKNECIDYEAISKDYDGIIINPYNNDFYFKTDIFKTWSVDTLLLFNIKCIESYKSLYISWDPDYINSVPKIETISETKLVEEKTKTYIELYTLAESLFIELTSQIKDISFKDYDEYFEKLTKISNKVINIIIKSNNIQLLEITEKYKNLNVRIKELTIIRNIVLNILSNFLDKNKESIITLPKTEHTKIKIYKL